MRTFPWSIRACLAILLVLLATLVFSPTAPLAGSISGTAYFPTPKVRLVASDGVTRLKPALRGLGAMGSPAFHHQRNNGIPDNIGDISALPIGIFDVAVVNVTWRQLESAPGFLTTAAIDEVLETVRNYNERNPATPLSLRLRVWSGSEAPDWAKDLGGAPVAVEQHNRLATIGRFWSDTYRQAWHQLQSGLAKRYDNEPLIHEVTMTSCASISSEPFVLPTDKFSIENLQSAGFTDRAYQNCLMEAWRDYELWGATRIEYPFNPFRGIDSGQLIINWDFSIAVMNAWRRQMGERGVLSNYDLKSPLGNRIVPIYEHMKSLGGPIELQLFAPKNLDLEASVAYGISLGASVIELWNSVIPSIPVDRLQQWSHELKAR
jgi:hypothetical protein